MKQLPKPPEHLSPRAQALWTDIVTTFEMSDAAPLELLRRACEASDRADEARDVLAREGLVVVDRHGQVKAHPCISVERDSRIALTRILRELRIVDAPEPPRVPRLA